LPPFAYLRSTHSELPTTSPIGRTPTTTESCQQQPLSSSPTFSSVLLCLGPSSASAQPLTSAVGFSSEPRAVLQPGIAFSLDLIETTGQYGVNEVLLASMFSSPANRRGGGEKEQARVHGFYQASQTDLCLVFLAFMAAFIFSVFGAQPLVISGVTGPSFPLLSVLAFFLPALIL
jgi:hypothetical protein